MITYGNIKTSEQKNNTRQASTYIYLFIIAKEQGLWLDRKARLHSNQLGSLAKTARFFYS